MPCHSRIGIDSEEVQEEALRLADSVNPVAQKIGAVNTLIRRPDGSLTAHNTDWSAAIGAIEAALADRQKHEGEL